MKKKILIENAYVYRKLLNLYTLVMILTSSLIQNFLKKLSRRTTFRFLIHPYFSLHWVLQRIIESHCGVWQLLKLYKTKRCAKEADINKEEN